MLLWVQQRHHCAAACSGQGVLCRRKGVDSKPSQANSRIQAGEERRHQQQRHQSSSPCLPGRVWRRAPASLFRTKPEVPPRLEEGGSLRACVGGCGGERWRYYESHSLDTNIKQGRCGRASQPGGHVLRSSLREALKNNVRSTVITLRYITPDRCAGFAILCYKRDPAGGSAPLQCWCVCVLL